MGTITPNQQPSAAEDAVAAGQRRINMVWEATQSGIAILVTCGMIYCEINKINSPSIINACFLIVGFYFSRTNHSAIGGVGPKPEVSPYIGR